MKTSTTAALVGVLALAAVGGGTAYALSQPEPVETPAAVSTETPAPTEATPEAEPTPEATEAVETPTPEPTPTVEYTEGEAMLIHVTQTGDLADLALDDAAILEAAATACGTDSSEAFAASNTIPNATPEQAKQFWIDAEYHVC